MATVGDLLGRKGGEVVVVPPDETVLEAAKRMNEARIGAVVVHTEDEGVVGIFTERDILRRVVAAGKDPASITVREVMTSPVACCKPNSSLDECQKAMTEKRLRHLPVVEDKKLAGIISSGDLLAREVEAQQSTIEYLHGYLHGRM